MKIIRIAKVALPALTQFAKDLANLTDFTYSTIYITFLREDSRYFMPNLLDLFYDNTLTYNQKVKRAAKIIEKRGYSRKGAKKSESIGRYIKEIAKRTGLNLSTLGVYIRHPRHKTLKDIYMMELPWEEKISMAVAYLDKNDIGYRLRGVTPKWPEYQDTGEKEKWEAMSRDIEDLE